MVYTRKHAESLVDKLYIALALILAQHIKIHKIKKRFPSDWIYGQI